MKILFISYTFYPNIGGVETVSELLSNKFVEFGHEIVLVTHTLLRDDDITKTFNFSVVRRPDLLTFLKLNAWSDIVFHNNISLNYFFQSFILGKPCVVAIHTWIRSASGRIRIIDIIKLNLLRFCKIISISKAIAETLYCPSIIIGDPYQERLFKIDSSFERSLDIVFLGRLVSDKGVDILLKAISILNNKSIYASLTIIGDGVERQNLENQVDELSLRSQVTFTGAMSGDELVQLLNRHKIMVIPSLWNEPFGVVALEGIACGCIVVGSEGGGLKDAIGSCGVTFPNGDHSALATILLNLLSNCKYLRSFEAYRENHLYQHSSHYVAQRYINVLKDVSNKK